MSAVSTDSWQAIVIGAGAAGLLAATRLAERGRRTLLLEKNTKPGVKILMSGGTRCNLTHATDAGGIVSAFGHQGRFLHSALAALGPQQLVDLFHAEGVPTKVEPGGKVFPVSDRALDVQRALLQRLTRSGCILRLKQPVQAIEHNDRGFRIQTRDSEFSSERLIVATGGRSYPGCGTTGDAYRWLTSLGHTIVSPRPALVPLTTSASWVGALSGITLPDVVVRVLPQTKVPSQDDPAARLSGIRRASLDERRGSMLFTHLGVSGPAALDISRTVTEFSDPSRLSLICDLLPDVSLDAILEQLKQGCQRFGSRSVVRILPDGLPQRLIEMVLHEHRIPIDRKAAELGKADRRKLAGALKALEIPLQGCRGFEKAEVTAGGVDLREVDSRSMQSKLVPNLYLVGEVLDLDGPIGGYNFQAAFSTGWLAAEKA